MLWGEHMHLNIIASYFLAGWHVQYIVLNYIKIKRSILQIICPLADKMTK